MEVIIPMAGHGTRMRPHTFSKPKPLMHVAGQPILGHILDRIKILKPKKVHFVISGFHEKVDDYIAKFPYNYTLTMQEKPAGDGGAIVLSKKYVDPESDVLVIFSDTIFETDFSELKKAMEKKQNLLYVKEVENPKRFGVVVMKDGYITEMVEKPEVPPSNLALIGMYYIRNAKMMFEALDQIQEEDIQSKGEFRLIDALALLIKKGEKFVPGKVDKWLDCGTPESILATNRELLKKHNKTIKTENSVIIPPVYIENGARIINSVIGPNVSIGTGTVIENSVIKDSILEVNARIDSAQLTSSLVGRDAKVKGNFKKISVGDNSELV